MSQHREIQQDSDPLITAGEFRRECGGISQVTYWRWERDGVIAKSIRINNRKYQPRSALRKIQGAT